MRFIDWFAGVGGFHLALTRAGHECAGACEIDPFARRVYEARFGRPGWFPEDIAVVRSADVPEAELWCGGWPCQDASTAGRRAGVFKGERSSLIWRLLELARVRKPRWLLLENVPGLLSGHDEEDEDVEAEGAGSRVAGDGPLRDPGARRDVGDASGGPVSWFGAVLGAMADVGYHDIAWRVLDARFLGVPQRRRRVFLLAGRAGAGRAAEVLLEPPCRGRDPAPRRSPGPQPAAGAGGGAAGAGGYVAPYTATMRARGARGGGGGADDNDARQGFLIAGPLQGTGVGSGHRVDAEGAANGHLIVEGDSAASTPSLPRLRAGCGRGGETYVAFGGNRTSGPREEAAALNAHGGPHGRLDFESETFLVKSHNGCAKATHAHQTEVAATVDGTGGYAPGQGGTLICDLRAGPPHPGGAILTARPVFVKARRAQSVDDVETWDERDVAPTFSGFDNRTEGRATVLAFGGKDAGMDAGADAPTLRAGGHHRSHANGGVAPAILVGFNSNSTSNGGHGCMIDGSPPVRSGPNPPAVAFHTSGRGGQVDDIAQPLQASDANLSNQVAGVIVPDRSFVDAASVGLIRRLMPVECERLMGWPDGHTCLCGAADAMREGLRLQGRDDWRTARLAGLTRACTCPDGARYRACGNGVVSNVVEWIIRRLPEEPRRRSRRT